MFLGDLDLQILYSELPRVIMIGVSSFQGTSWTEGWSDFLWFESEDALPS